MSRHLWVLTPLLLTQRCQSHIWALLTGVKQIWELDSACQSYLWTWLSGVKTQWANHISELGVMASTISVSLTHIAYVDHISGDYISELDSAIAITLSFTWWCQSHLWAWLCMSTISMNLTQRCQSHLWAGLNGIGHISELDSNVWITFLSLTQRYQSHLWTWLSDVNHISGLDSIASVTSELGSDVSITSLSLAQWCQSHLWARLISVTITISLSLTQRC